MIWWVIGAFVFTLGWPLLGFLVVDWVDDENHRLGVWVLGPKDDPVVSFFLVYLWPIWVWKWIRQKQ